MGNTDKLSSCMFVPDGAWLEDIDSTEQKTPNNRDLSHTGLCSPGLCDIYMSRGTNSLLLGHSQPVASLTKYNSCVPRGCWSSSHHVCTLRDRNGNRRREKRVLILVFSSLFKKASQKYSTQFHLYFNGCNLVTWPHLVVRASGECNLGWAPCCPIVSGFCYQVTRVKETVYQSVLLLLSGHITSF